MRTGFCPFHRWRTAGRQLFLAELTSGCSGQILAGDRFDAQQPLVFTLVLIGIDQLQVKGGTENSLEGGQIKVDRRPFPP
jgi:hypothetical protein